MQSNTYNQRELQELPVIEELVGEKMEAERTASELENPIKLGVVTDCIKLNVRKSPSVDADIICEIPKLTEVAISEKESTCDFYRICTDSGIEGFCMKKYILVSK